MSCSSCRLTKNSLRCCRDSLSKFVWTVPPTPSLRRPISINLVDYDRNELWLLVAAVGEGTRHLASLHEGDTLNCVLPLGNGFTMPKTPEDKWLLIGGGVGIAPLLYFGQEIVRMGAKPTFLLGARSESDLLELEEFRKLGRVLITTEDGSAGEQGFVTNHSVLQHERFDQISTCGPNPMMKLLWPAWRPNWACAAKPRSKT